MAYVDGFVVPVPKRKLRAYARMAEEAAQIWRDHGALEYRECVGDDLDVKFGRPFPKQLRLEGGETVVFSWILYRSRAERDRVMAAVMKDPRMDAYAGKPMPFDPKRMLYGGFETIVDVAATSRARPSRSAPSASRRRRAGTRRSGSGA